MKKAIELASNSQSNFTCQSQDDLVSIDKVKKNFTMANYLEKQSISEVFSLPSWNLLSQEHFV